MYHRYRLLFLIAATLRYRRRQISTFNPAAATNLRPFGVYRGLYQPLLAEIFR